MKEFAKKRSFISNSSIFECFASKDPLKNDDVEQKMLLENLALLIMKNHMLLQFVQSVWLKCLMLQLCSIPFLKIIFKHNFAWIGGKNQRNICFAFAKWL